MMLTTVWPLLSQDQSVCETLYAVELFLFLSSEVRKTVPCADSVSLRHLFL